MANFWFRLYKEFSTDPKVQMLSESYQRRFIMLLCNRCGNDGETFQDCSIAFQMRISESEWAETKQEFIRLGLCDNDNNPINWDKWQYPSDSSTARVRKFREKKATGVKRFSNVSVTPQSRVEKSKEDQIKEEKPLGDKPPVSVPSKKRFIPPTVEEVEAYCQERGNGISGQYFVDSNQAKGWVVGKNRTPMIDWKATVRTWEETRKTKTNEPLSRADRIAQELRAKA